MAISYEEHMKLRKLIREDDAKYRPCRCGHQWRTHTDTWGCKLCDDCLEYQPKPVV